MDGGQIAVFAVQDMLLFFLAWELELLPVYLLLAIWGGTKRQYAAKYHNAATGDSWAGRGKQPRWLTAALASGAKITDFAV